MQDGYKISLIIPVYNAQQYLEQTLESVRRQTIGFESIELLLVDDCSTDQSGQILERWAAQYPNVRSLRTEQNSGTPAEPRNVGIEAASAPYLMFLDNDDELFPDACKTLYETAGKTGADLVSGSVRLMHPELFSEEQRKTLVYGTEQNKTGFFRKEPGRPDWLWAFLNNHWCKIYRRDLVEKYGIRCLKGELWEDILFLFQYILHSETFFYMHDPIVLYRVRPESLSHVLDKAFYCSLPRSIECGMAHALRYGKAEEYVDLLDYGFSIVEYYVDKLLDAENLEPQDLKEALFAWKKTIVFAARHGAKYHSAYSRILCDDFSEDQDQKAWYHFCELKILYKQRQTEINNILDSNTFRLAQRLSGIKEFLRRKKG